MKGTSEVEELRLALSDMRATLKKAQAALMHSRENERMLLEEARKPIQIIPANRGWHVLFGSSRHEVACWALMTDGAVEAMVPDENLEILVPARELEESFTLLTPAESWTYGTTHPSGGVAIKPPSGCPEDAEAVAIASDSEDGSVVLWRWA